MKNRSSAIFLNQKKKWHTDSLSHFSFCPKKESSIYIALCDFQFFHLPDFISSWNIV